MSDDVTKLPVKFKAPPSDERTLEIVRDVGHCNHTFTIDGGKIRHVRYIIDEGAAEVECSACKAKLTPMWVLTKMAHKETQYHETERRYHDSMRRLSERSRVKCEHCNRMTQIRGR